MDDLYAVWDRYVNTGEMDKWVRPVIRQAWERCRVLGVDPKRLPPQTLDPETLRSACERSHHLLDVADPFIHGIHESFGDQPHVVALLDPDAVVIRLLADPKAMNAGSGSSTFFEGASWAEKDVGCNGGGSAITVNTPIIFLGPEHFIDGYLGWTCIGIPLRDSTGTVVGAIDLSIPNEHVRLQTWGWILHIGKTIEAHLALPDSLPSPAEVSRVVNDIQNPFNIVKGVLDLIAKCVVP